ncbi:hypothetical protein HMSSN036_86100 [Paenibacillus macerans]|nr:hypothetical protein HMSSN036_86100 [Paenibacillus macerans]
MALKQTLTVIDALDSAHVNGEAVKRLFAPFPGVSVTVQTVTGEKGSTDFIKVMIPGANGKNSGGSAPTLGIVGRLGGIGARPSRIGIVPTRTARWRQSLRL